MSRKKRDEINLTQFIINMLFWCLCPKWLEKYKQQIKDVRLKMLTQICNWGLFWIFFFLAFWFQETKFIIQSRLLCSNTILLLKLQIELCAQSMHGYLNKQTHSRSIIAATITADVDVGQRVYSILTNRLFNKITFRLLSYALHLHLLLQHIREPIENLMCFALFLNVVCWFHFECCWYDRLFSLFLSFSSWTQFMRMSSCHLKCFSLKNRTKNMMFEWLSFSFGLLFLPFS